jgi:hypothetical protein
MELVFLNLRHVVISGSSFRNGFNMDARHHKIEKSNVVEAQGYQEDYGISER